MDIQCITDERALLGESPVWSAKECCVYWVDILARKLHRTDPYEHKTQSWELPSSPGMIALRSKGGLVIALQDGIYGFDPSSSQLELLLTLESGEPENRPNDGKCDAAGRLWVGTMNSVDPNRTSGNFYRIDPDLTVTRMESEFRIPNGLAWNPENTVMFHTDTRSNIVLSYKFDSSTGEISQQKDYFHFDRETSGGVDGAAMDVEGGYWAALYRGRKLIRVLPDGKPDREIKLPVSQPTMPAFGGPDMKTLFVTSARQNLDDTELRSQPLAGGLLAIAVDVVGHQVYSFSG